MIELDVHISQITYLSSRTVVSCHSATDVDIGGQCAGCFV